MPSKCPAKTPYKSGPETQAALQNVLLKLLAKMPYKSGLKT